MPPPLQTPLSARVATLPPGWPAGVGRILLDSVGSTNAEAFRRADQAPVWVMARCQTAGRGRRGRAWDDPPGNFAASLAMRPGDGPAGLALRSFTAALALAEALEGLTGLHGAFALKWPNDLLLEEGKLSGILLETGPGGLLVIGIGVNLRHTPPAAPDAAFSPVALHPATGHDIAPEALLEALAPAFAAWEARLSAEGFAPVRAAWLSRAAHLGQPVTAKLGNGAVLSGRFDGIGADGTLRLATAQGVRDIPAADVFFA